MFAFADIIALTLSFSGIWIFVVVLVSFPAVQRHVIYAHKLPIWWRQKLDIPESFGYLPNQVSAHTVETTDQDKLFAWLVIPLKAYMQNEAILMTLSNGADARTNALRIIQADAAAKVIIYFHGNASTVGSTRRTEAYRSVSASDSAHVYVLSFDYRGFGRSTGSPTERRLIDDAISIIRWAHQTCKVPHDRIMILSQSLGTAVASAAVARLLVSSEVKQFAGIVLCAPFTNALDILLSFEPYKGWKLLAPVRYFPPLERWLANRIADKWHTDDNISTMIDKHRHLKLTLLCCLTDDVIPASMTDILSDRASDMLGKYGSVSMTTAMLGNGGIVQEWRATDMRLRKVVVHYGGHNTVMKWAPVAYEVARMWGSD